MTVAVSGRSQSSLFTPSDGQLRQLAPAKIATRRQCPRQQHASHLHAVQAVSARMPLFVASRGCCPALACIPAVIISYFDPASVGNLGLMTIPCIVFYIMQLFIDSFIANTWASKYERFAAVEASYNEQMQQLESSSGGADQVSSKVVAKLAAGAAALASGAGSEGDGLISTVVAGGATRPSRGALTLRRSSHSDGEEAGLMQNVELNEVNPMAEGNGAAAPSTQQHCVSWK